MNGRKYPTATRRASAATIARAARPEEIDFTLYLSNGTTVSGSYVDNGKIWMGRNNFVLWAQSLPAADYAAASVNIGGRMVYLRDIEKIG